MSEEAKSEDVLKPYNVISTYHRRESGSEAPSRWAIFREFLEKKAILLPHWIPFRKYSKPFESTRFLTFESQLKKLSCSVLRLFAI